MSLFLWFLLTMEPKLEIVLIPRSPDWPHSVKSGYVKIWPILSGYRGVKREYEHAGALYFEVFWRFNAAENNTFTLATNSRSNKSVLTEFSGLSLLSGLAGVKSMVFAWRDVQICPDTAEIRIGRSPDWPELTVASKKLWKNTYF